MLKNTLGVPSLEQPKFIIKTHLFKIPSRFFCVCVCVCDRGYIIGLTFVIGF